MSEGESAPINGTVNSTDDNYLETHCIGLQGTHCVAGSAVGVVVSTGDSTVFGRIAKLTSEPKKGLTTLEKEILRFVSFIVAIMLAMIILVVGVWYVLPEAQHVARYSQSIGLDGFEKNTLTGSTFLL